MSLPSCRSHLLSQTSGDLSGLPTLLSLPLSHIFLHCNLAPPSSTQNNWVLHGPHCEIQGGFLGFVLLPSQQCVAC